MGIFDWLFGSNNKNEKNIISSDKKKKIRKKPKKTTNKKKWILTEDQEYWIELVNIRVNSMPLDSTASIGFTVDSLGRAHFEEYKTNEFRVPEDKREEVALDRLQGLLSIKEYIKNKGTKAQKFHHEASLNGAILYASSLGLNIEDYKI